MTVDSKDLFSKWILRRAWALINSSTELPYKNFVRSLFASYSINARENIDSLFSRLKNNTYEPTPPCRLYSPKQSGILRPYSLLTTDDQIVYQAFAIWIANALSKRVCRRYYKTVFSHIYAGQSARFFYRPWKLGYDLLNKSIRRSHAEGFAWFATFDLTAFYDSIDHTILRKSLEILRLDKDYISLLCNDWLPIWTTSHPKEQWIQGHGLPQSPLASGLLAESVMRHFDEVLEKWKSIKYYRYVDDIKIMARDERTLRLALVKLDLRSKELGLFPQVSKIQPRHVTIIDSELKNITLVTMKCY